MICSPVSQDSRSERPVLVRKTSSRLGRCSSIERSVQPGAVERAQDLRDRGGAVVDVEAQAALVGRSPACSRTARRRAAPPPCRRWPASRPTSDHVAGDLALELVRRALGDDLAVVHDRDPVAERVGLVEVVRGEEDGHALGAQPADLVPHVGPALRVEAGGRLVQEDDLRLVDDAERDVDPAALAAGVGLALAVGVLGELERVQRARRPAAAPRPCRCRTSGPAAPAPRGRSTRPRCCRPGPRSRSGGAPRPGPCAGRRRRRWPRRRRARCSVASMRSVVVLPAPLGPRKPKISPSATVRSTPADRLDGLLVSRPSRERNDFRSPLVSIITAPGRPGRRAGRSRLGRRLDGALTPSCRAQANAI